MQGLEGRVPWHYGGRVSPTFPFLQGFSSREITKLKEVYRRFDLDRRRQKDGVDSMTLCICGGRNNQGKMGAVDMFGETHGVDMC